MKFWLTFALLASWSFAQEAWLVTLKIDQQQVSLISKEKIQAKLKKSRLQIQPELPQLLEQVTSDFVWVLKDAQGNIVQKHTGEIPGTIHADFATEEQPEFSKHTQESATFQVVIPSQEGLELEFYTLDPTHSPEGQGGSSEGLSKFKSAGKVSL